MQRTQWQSISTVRFQGHKASSFSHLLLSVMVLILLQGCAMRGGDPSARIPEQAGVEASLETLNQGLKYIREHPPAGEEEQVQRFLWLDQWVRVLQDKERLSPEMASEYSRDLTAFVSEPPMGLRSLERLQARAQTVLGKNIVAFRTYEALLTEQRVNDAVSQMRMIENDGITELYSKAQEILNVDLVKMVADSRKIGVLVPLTGDLAAFGQASLQSIQVVSNLAYADGVEFVVEDSGSTLDDLARAWRKLTVEDRVTAIIGPITTRETEWVFERAELLRIPAISLAPKEKIKSFGPHGFRSVISLEDQVSRLVSFIRSDLKAKRVGLLVPDSVYGWDVVSVLKPALEDARLELAQVGIYPENATDFKAPLRQMTKLDVPQLRRNEVCPKGVTPPPPGCVKKLADLRPIVDFEVLIVPDFAETAGLLLPTLPYLRIYGLQVVGLSGFNSPLLIQRGGESVEGVIFTDGFLPTANDFQTRFFVKRYRELTGKDPNRLAAETFDLAMMIVEILKTSSGPITRPEFISRVSTLKNFPGVTGPITAEGTKLRRQPRLIVARNGDFSELRLK